MDIRIKQLAVPVLALGMAAFAQPGACAEAQVNNEYLDMDIVQLMNITVTSAAK